MNTEIKKSVAAADAEARYDEQAKRLLGNKSILAHILIRTVDAFRSMDPEEVKACIEGDPIIGKVPVDPGLTNDSKRKDGQRVRGLQTESGEIHEGVVRFDIVCYVRTKDGLSQIIINVEAQKSEPTKYDILNRAVFYVSRLISSQKEREFVHSDYNDMKQVISIWICLGMKECVWNDIHLTDRKLLGNYRWKGRLDLFHIVMIGVPNEVPEQDERYELHRLLSALLSMDLTVDQKLDIIEKEYQIATESGIGKEMRDMCNLSQGVLERGIAQGLERGIERGIAQGLERGIEQGTRQSTEKWIRNLHDKGISVELIADAAELSIGEVEAILGGNPE